ncbi:NADH dehydrogenase subunit 4L (mitochondrion) [Lepeophtheirus salmonis]|uniref:NADH dehydrogenase subunit 4L n=1 Tax=Lepeophtheirus salmonis TaxID=72036 RepID=A0A1M4NF41_LEPSM|nr:NADH dehydrogenase subunit 4L [Lepeophtheirus salmonis]CAF3048552.1 NADH dehydrogenase subunit 4L [Lepeophtheirus salmonis]CAH1385100.1 NADH dehydrogenase subunit 4L [Lepeophtheirus salmonis]CAH1385112.1 NADH dehydrogenase subunit 4L [Lepeophtheirus salmonis]SFW10613.1 NADH dehydrogenase subunit 4L [Lepeophtheirus salmonis]
MSTILTTLVLIFFLPHLSSLYLLALPPLFTSSWFLFNKGHLLISLLLLEALTATMIPICIFFSVFSMTYSTISFLFVTVMVCEACMGLAALISSIRSKSTELSHSTFFTY